MVLLRAGLTHDIPVHFSRVRQGGPSFCYLKVLLQVVPLGLESMPAQNERFRDVTAALPQMVPTALHRSHSCFTLAKGEVVALLPNPGHSVGYSRCQWRRLFCGAVCAGGAMSGGGGMLGSSFGRKFKGFRDLVSPFSSSGSGGR